MSDHPSVVWKDCANLAIDSIIISRFLHIIVLYPNVTSKLFYQTGNFSHFTEILEYEKGNEACCISISGATFSQAPEQNFSWLFDNGEYIKWMDNVAIVAMSMVVKFLDASCTVCSAYCWYCSIHVF
jgi:hypothetical protein